MITFRVYGIPKAQPRPRAFARKFGDKWAARVYDSATAEGFKSAIAAAARLHLPSAPLQGPVRITVHLYFSRPKWHFRSNGTLKPQAPTHHTSRPDIENCLKAVFDSLTQIGMWQDDAQICSEVSTKEYHDQPGALIEIEEIPSEVAA